MTPPLVLLHGFTGAPESWGEVLELLNAPDGRPADAPTGILALHAIGHDGTPGTAGVTTFEDELDRLAGELRARGVEDAAHLAGYSMGGRLALGLLVRHPDLFASATLIGASPGLPDRTEQGPPERDPAAERRARADWDETWARLLEAEGLSTFVAAWEALPMFASQGELPPDSLKRQRRIRRAHDPRGLARSLRVIGLGRMPDYRPRLGEIDVPVRLVVGERDAKFRGLASEMAALIPRAEIVVVEGAGHNVVLERPDTVARLLREGMNEGLELP